MQTNQFVRKVSTEIDEELLDEPYYFRDITIEKTDEILMNLKKVVFLYKIFVEIYKGHY